MGFEEIRIAIEMRVAQWDEAPVDYDGIPASPSLQQAIESKASWMRCRIDHGVSFTAGVGHKPCVRRTGLIIFQIFTPENSGSRPAAVLADSLAAHFEYSQAGAFETQAASVQRIGESDGWYQYNVSLPFRAG